MTMTAFNTHEVAEILSDAGFTKDQVNAQVGVLTEVTGELVTKSYLRNSVSLLRRDMVILKRDIIITVGIMQFTFALAMLTAMKSLFT